MRGCDKKVIFATECAREKRESVVRRDAPPVATRGVTGPAREGLGEAASFGVAESSTDLFDAERGVCEQLTSRLEPQLVLYGGDRDPGVSQATLERTGMHPKMVGDGVNPLSKKVGAGFERIDDGLSLRMAWCGGRRLAQGSPSLGELMFNALRGNFVQGGDGPGEWAIEHAALKPDRVDRGVVFDRQLVGVA